MKVLLIATEDQKEELLGTLEANDTLVCHPSLPISPGNSTFDACIDLLFQNSPERCALLAATAPLIVINEVETLISTIRHDFVKVNGWPGCLAPGLIEAAGNTNQRSQAEDLFKQFGKTLEWLPDTSGFITPRIISVIINEAFLALEEELSSAHEIDIAMKMGTNYPYGPFEWCRRIGIKRVYSLLAALENIDARYGPSQLLKDQALA